MADGNLQHSIFHAVVNGQRNSNRRNFDIAHDAAAGNIKQVLVIGSIFLGGLKPCTVLGQLGIVGLGVGPCLPIGCVVQLGHLLGIAGDGAGLMKRVPPVAGCGIQQQGQPCQKDDKQ